MQSSVLKDIRDKIKAIGIDFPLQDGTTYTYHPDVTYVCANGADRFTDHNDECTKWDDTNEVVYSFMFNNNSSTNYSSFSRGGAVKTPVKFQVVAYEDITRIESVFNWELVEQMANSLSMSTDEIRSIFEHRFRAADIDWQVKHIPRPGYSPVPRKYLTTDQDEYNATVHPVQL